MRSVEWIWWNTIQIVVLLKAVMPVQKKSRCYYAVVTILYVVPIILLMCGAGLLLKTNTRSMNIELYNKRATEWNTTGLKEFGGMRVSIKVANQQKEMESVTVSTGAFYPVRDSCNRNGDPEEGCVYTPALYYKTDIPYSNASLPFTLYHEKSLIVDDTIVPVIERKLYVHDLNCDHDTAQCKNECDKYHGVWDTKEETCTYNDYLSHVCYRVNMKNNHLVLDKPAAWDLSTHNVGCEYGNNWVPFVYSTEKRSSIPVEIRYYKDSAISASFYTEGCSDSNMEEAKCMGITHKEASQVGVSITVIGLCVLATTLIGVSIVNRCRREEKEEEKPLTTV